MGHIYNNQYVYIYIGNYNFNRYYIKKKIN